VANRIRLGNATLTRVLECQVDDLPVAVFPKTPPDAWFELADEFAPTFWNDDRWRIALQVWVVEVDGLTVLVDTGVGNDRVRPRMWQLDHLQTDFLESLRRAGIEPEDVDVVINTHLHFDHVGWNTMRDGDAWVPTFPNARYLMPEADYRHFNPDGPVQTSRPRTEEEESVQRHVRTVFADSVSPWKGRSNYGPTTISSLRRLGFVRRRATPREPRWYGSTPASLRCSLAT
jgi:Metallo-beta-lactamase superfamily